jgi:archaetidylinositol phosphate synthase
MSTMTIAAAEAGRKQEGAVFREARREMGGWTARAEKRLLVAMASRLPGRVTPDHLTALGFAGMLLAGAAYAWAGRNPLALHLVNLGLLLNWFGDSLDGTLARHRGRLRPRYGFYVDHVIDAFGATAVLGGLALSGLMSPVLAAAVLVPYLLFSVHLYLQTHVLGRFRMSFGRIGGTELRLLLALVNLAVLAWPRLSLFGLDLRLLDLVGAAGGAALVAALVSAVTRTTAELYRLERIPER